MSEVKRLPAQVYSPEKTKAVMEVVMVAEASDFPAVEQDRPIAVKAMYQDFVADFEGAENQYWKKRAEIVGVARKVGPDIHNKPCVELSDSVDGECYAACVFKSADVFSKVSVGDTVICRGNLSGIVEPFGMVFKKCEVI